jgi:peptidyl-prolyl cis-trans isomerase SurA
MRFKSLSYHHFRSFTVASRSLSSLLFAAFLLGCAPKQQEPIVARIGEDPLPLKEYERIYVKSNGSRDSGAVASMDERAKFLDLVVKYKLKLKDAYAQGLDKKRDVAEEIAQYKGSLAQSFLTDREVVKPGIQQLYKRRTEEVRTAHILLPFPANASAADSIKAYKSAQEVIDSVKAGRDFGTFAAKISTDPSAAENKGDLYYATGGDFVGPFEDAAYTLKKGEVYPTPVRTRFGLHIIKMLDRKPNEGEVHAGHIMVRFPSATPSPDDTAKSYAKIRKIQDSLALGVDFADLARRNSEDGGSASRGGDLGWFSRRRWVRPFDDSAFTLKAGQVSGIVRTSYGYHLIKCTERRPLKPFEEMRQEIETMYQQRRFPDDNAAFLNRLRSNLRYTRNDSVLALLLPSVDTTKTVRDSAWAAHVTPAVGKSPLITVLGRPISVDSVLALLQARNEPTPVSLRPAQFTAAIDKVGEQILWSTKADLLMGENAEFAGIMSEYQQGVLLYQIEQERVWGKITPTDSLLQAFFQRNRDKFTFPDRVRFTEIHFSSDPVARAARERLLKGATINQLVEEDSLRMALPNSYTLEYPQQSARQNGSLQKTIASIADQLSNDAALTVRLTGSPDTLKDKTRNMNLASQRIQAIKTALTKNHGIAENRILLTVTPLAKDSTMTQKERLAQSRRVTAAVLGRHSYVIGKPEQNILAPAADERAKRADSLTVGGYSESFFYKVGYCILRLDSREPSRQKTYEEAGGEVSTSFQDFEAKRLEKEWIDGLRQRYPVVEQKEVLRNAFAPEK